MGNVSVASSKSAASQVHGAWNGGVLLRIEVDNPYSYGPGQTVILMEKSLTPITSWYTSWLYHEIIPVITHS